MRIGHCFFSNGFLFNKEWYTTCEKRINIFMALGKFNAVFNIVVGFKKYFC